MQIVIVLSTLAIRYILLWTSRMPPTSNPHIAKPPPGRILAVDKHDCFEFEDRQQTISATSLRVRYLIDPDDKIVCNSETMATSAVRYEHYEAAAAYIRAQLPGSPPKIAIVCGTGLGGIVGTLDKSSTTTEIAYADIPHFPRPTGKHVAILSTI